jgi:hypothetical protein
LSRPEWLGLNIPLGSGMENLTFSAAAAPYEQQLDGSGAVGKQRVARVAVIRCRGWQAVHAPRRRTSQTVAAMSSSDSASSQPPLIHWNGQNRVTGWYLVHCV